MTSANAIRSQQSICLRGSSFMAFVLTPAAPIADWLARARQMDQELSQLLCRQADHSGPCGAKPPQSPRIAADHDIGRARNPRSSGSRASTANLLGPPLPPLLKGGRLAAGAERSSRGPAPRPRTLRPAGRRRGMSPTRCCSRARCARANPWYLPYGDVTVLGAVVLGRRGRCRRLDPRLRHAARTSHGGLHGQRSRADLLQQERSRADRDRRVLPDCRGHECDAAQPAGPVLARRPRSVDSSLGLKGARDGKYGQGAGGHIRQGRRRQDDVHRRARRGARARRARRSRWSISTSGCATSTW